MKGWKGVVGAVAVFAATSGAAQGHTAGNEGSAGRARPEVAVGVFEHGSNFHPLADDLIFDLPDLPDGQIYEGSEEDGTIDVQIVYRTAPLQFALEPRLTAKVQINTAGRTSFASIGAEWRQHVLRNRVYGQVGIGLSVHDGYRFTPDPFEPGLARKDARRRFANYREHTSFGSRVLFNPNASIGIRLNQRLAVEASWEHFSHARLFSGQNPGIDNLGIRLVHTFGANR